ncbi:MAG: cell division protein FtsA [Pseudomonadota bacterium]
MGQKTAAEAKSAKSTAKPSRSSVAAARGRIIRTYGALDVGSFRISAMIIGETEMGELLVLGSSQRRSRGINCGDIAHVKKAAEAIREAIAQAEDDAQTSIQDVWIAYSGAGLGSDCASVSIPIDGRRVETEDVRDLMRDAAEKIQPFNRFVLHAQPAHFTLDQAHHVEDPCGLYAEHLGVEVHVTLAEGALLKNLREAVNNAHYKVAGVVAAPLASAQVCLTREERELGVALVEIGCDVTTVSVFYRGMLAGLSMLRMGSNSVTEGIASHFGIREFQAERLKCVAGSASASPTDHSEMIPVDGPSNAGSSVHGTDRHGNRVTGQIAIGADEQNRIPRAPLVAVVTQSMGQLMSRIDEALKSHGFSGPLAGQVVMTGGGAELHGLAEFAQGALARPVRIARIEPFAGLPAAQATPAASTLAGLCLYVANPPEDISQISMPHQDVHRPHGNWNPFAAAARMWHAARENF